MNHGRLPWLSPSDLDDEQRRVYDLIVAGPRSQSTRASALVDERGRLEGPFNAMLVDPAVGEAVQNLGAVIRYATLLNARTREIATLVVARSAKSNFEWHAHAHLGRAAGITEDELAGILEEREPSTFDETERLVWRITRMLVGERDLDDATYAQAESALGRAVVMDLVVLVGYYELLARSLRVWRTPLPEGAAAQFEQY